MNEMLEKSLKRIDEFYDKMMKGESVGACRNVLIEEVFNIAKSRYDEAHKQIEEKKEDVKVAIKEEKITEDMKNKLNSWAKRQG